MVAGSSIFDKRTGRFRDSVTGKFVNPDTAPSPGAPSAQLDAIAQELRKLTEAQRRIEQQLKRRNERDERDRSFIGAKLDELHSVLNAPSANAVLTLTLVFTAVTGVAMAARATYEAYQSVVASIPGQQWGERSTTPEPARPTTLQQLFEGGSDSLVAIAVGNAEGTRTLDGGKTSAYAAHTDPGNGVTNQGTFSYQHSASSPEDADRRQLQRLRGQLEDIAKDLPPDIDVWLNAADLLNQSPAAGRDFPKYLQQCNGDILCARVASYQGDAPGITRNGITIEQDQRRRMDAIAHVAKRQGAASSGWINPLPQGTFTSGFGYRVHPLRQFTTCHMGIDLAAPTGTPILAAKAGTVAVSGDAGDGFGYKVVLSHPDGSRSLYAHASKLMVREGQQVNQGDRVALVGSTGNSTGPHLHFEVTDTQRRIIDPLPLLPAPPNGAQTFGTIDSEASKECMGRSL